MRGDKSMLMDDYYPVPLSERAKPKQRMYIEPDRPKKGDLKPMDAYEQGIIANASYYTVTLFQHGSSTRAYAQFKTVEECKEYCKDELNKDTPFRAAMAYAVDEYDHFALMFTLRKGEEDFKYPLIKYY